MIKHNKLWISGQGQGPARQAALHAGIPSSVPAYGVNMLCGSGLKAVALGYQSVSSDKTSIVVAGGQESMSQVNINLRKWPTFCFASTNQEHYLDLLVTRHR